MKIILFLCMLLPLTAFAGNEDILFECRPDAVFYNQYRNPSTRATIMQTYSGVDFPDQAEWDACEVSVEKRLARNSKLEALNDKGIEHVCRTSGLCYESWNALIIAYNDWVSIAPAAKQATAAKSKAINHYQPWSDARTTINNYTGLGSITFFNVSTMVSWP